MSEISYIIPHKGRDAMLLWHLELLNDQFFKDFDVVVVVDEDVSDLIVESNNYQYPITVSYLDKNRGPAKARNMGVNMAQSDIVMFVGDDCLPSKDLIARHWITHNQYGNNIVQGYTSWHEEAYTPFMIFLDMSGMQANWNSIKDDKGEWIREVSAGFCLTTNYSIKKQTFAVVGGFDETFTGAAWEDIEFGYRLSKFGWTQRFVPEAINYHHHSYELPSWLNRCYMEGTHRQTICTLHPEMGFSLLEPETIRRVIDLSTDEVLSRSLKMNISSEKEIFDTYVDACKVFSFKGAIDRIDEGFGGLQALKYIEHPHESIETLAGTAAVENKRYSYALHCGEWMITQRPQYFYTHAFLAEIKREVGDIDGALTSTRNALTLNPNSTWARELARELSRA